MAQEISLNGREFVMESSTASRVDPVAPTRFQYSEREGVVWGSYLGDTVTEGRFVGTREADRLTVWFVHALVDGGDVVSGTSVSVIETDAEGGIRLVENFEIDGAAHVSVCTEVRQLR
jgi:hypothetical protein